MGHLDRVSAGDGRDAPPFGRSAAPTRIEITDVDCAGRHQVAAAERGDLALAGADRDAGLAARGGHVEAVVVPAHRLLEPADLELGGETGELDGVTERPALVGVDDED